MEEIIYVFFSTHPREVFFGANKRGDCTLSVRRQESKDGKDGQWVLYSYQTPIARRFDATRCVWVNPNRYSRTTSRQQNVIRRYLSSAEGAYRFTAWVWHVDPVTYDAACVQQDQQQMEDLKAQSLWKGVR